MRRTKEEVRTRILRTASRLFHEQGIRAVRMDDLALKLKISKRTLYEFFPHKVDLLIECHKLSLRDRDTLNAELAQKATDVMEVIVWNMRMALDSMRSISHAFFKDISRYPELTSYLAEANRRDEEKVVEFLQRGVEQGLLLEGINYRIFYNTAFTVGDRSLLNEYTPYDIFMSSSYPFIRGCCTEKGRERLDAFIERYKEENRL